MRTLLVTALMGVSMASHAWDEVKLATNGDYYTSVDSDSASFVVYADADNKCNPYAMFLDAHHYESFDGEKPVNINLQLRIDRQVIQQTGGKGNLSISENIMLIRYYFKLDDESFFGDLLTGNSLKLRYKAGGMEEYSQTYNIPLTGSNNAIMSAVQACLDNEWSVEPSNDWIDPDWSA